MKKLIVLAAIALSLSGCGAAARGLGGTWVDTPNDKQVWCVGASDSGGISCDWDHQEPRK